MDDKEILKIIESARKYKILWTEHGRQSALVAAGLFNFMIHMDLSGAPSAAISSMMRYLQKYGNKELNKFLDYLKSHGGRI